MFKKLVPGEHAKQCWRQNTQTSMDLQEMGMAVEAWGNKQRNSSERQDISSQVRTNEQGNEILTVRETGERRQRQANRDVTMTVLEAERKTKKKNHQFPS